MSDIRQLHANVSDVLAELEQARVILDQQTSLEGVLCYKFGLNSTITFPRNLNTF